MRKRANIGYGDAMHTFKHLIIAAVLLAAGCKKAAKDEKQPETAPAAADATSTAVVTDAAPPPEVKPYTPAADVTDAIRAAVTATDRTVDDRALDAGRKPGEVLTFFRIAPGQKVAELFAGGGYTTELMAGARCRVSQGVSGRCGESPSS